MIWTPSGCYDTGHSGFNFPPQFMSEWTSMEVATTSVLDQVGAAGVSLGFWWGNSGSIPVPVQWNPTSEVAARPISKAADASFLMNELALARARGTKEIGLDAFTTMPVAEQYNWIDQMQAAAPEI